MRVIVIHSNLEPGGAETSLIGLLEALDSHGCEVDLFLYRHEGALMRFIPKGVRLLPECRVTRAFDLPAKEALRRGGFAAVAARSAAKFLIALRRSFGYALSPDGLSYLSKRLVHRLALPFIPRIPGEYDLCLSFIDPHYIAVHRTRAKRVIGWLHTDFGAIGCVSGADIRMWGGCDRIATVSHSCKRAFDSAMSSLAYKSFVAENILSCNMVKSQSLAALGAEMDRGALKLLSVGRFAHAKNFDNIPDICHRIRKFGYDCVWYIIGYGGDEELIKRRIKEAGCGDSVILLGRRDNPYPYIAACDIYVQPSRYEGKSVAVREAQMLGKCVVITAYPTSASQLEDGVDGVIVPLDNAGCAAGIAALLADAGRRRRISAECSRRDYSNSDRWAALVQGF